MSTVSSLFGYGLGLENVVLTSFEGGCVNSEPSLADLLHVNSFLKRKYLIYNKIFDYLSLLLGNFWSFYTGYEKAFVNPLPRRSYKSQTSGRIGHALQVSHSFCVFKE